MNFNGTKQLKYNKNINSPQRSNRKLNHFTGDQPRREQPGIKVNLST